MGKMRRRDLGGLEKGVAEGRWGTPSRLKENEGQRWTIQCSRRVQEDKGAGER